MVDPVNRAIEKPIRRPPEVSYTPHGMNWSPLGFNATGADEFFPNPTVKVTLNDGWKELLREYVPEPL